ncbi:luciferin sulfotransferase-like [Penaeus indicus]|uniref:luciferin sulfotransferase-like n=1 Tax=Penaeus indicus TaxID=29960 RepID=UPI00300C61DE
MRLASGHVAVQLEGEELAKIQRDFEGYRKGLVRLTPGGWVLPAPYPKYADKLYNTKFRETDVVIMTYPKCGTTWTQEVVWTMRNNPNLDHPKASAPVSVRSPFIDSDMLMAMGKEGTTSLMSEFLKGAVPDPDPNEGIALQLTAHTPDPRTIKTHLPFSLMTPDLLDTAKVIYVARNPKDVVLSFLHHTRFMKNISYVGSLEQFVDYFVNDQYIKRLAFQQFRKTDVVIMTYPKCGTTWTQEVVWTMRNNPNLDHPKASAPGQRSFAFHRVIYVARNPKDVVLSFLHHTRFMKNISYVGSLEQFVDYFVNDQYIKRLAFQQFRKTDVVIMTYPKCGTTWTQEVVWTMRNNPNLDHPKASAPVSVRLHILLDTAKVIYVARNPKDVVLSFLHHTRFMKNISYVGSLEQFVDYFVNDQLIYGPYWEHLREAWPRRDHPNMHFVFYEDMKADPMAELRKLNQFLRTDLTEEQLEKIVQYTSFEEMKKHEQDALQGKNMATFVNEEVVKKDGGFYRKGEAGGWKDRLTDMQAAKIDAWTKKNTLDLGITFKYSI